MEILSNKNEIIKIIENAFTDLNFFTKETPISSVTQLIRDKVLQLGTEIFKIWFYDNIGDGYKGPSIRNETNQSIEYKFNGYKDKNYVCCLGNVKLRRAYYIGEDRCFFPIEESTNWLKDEFLPDVKELSCLVSMIEPYYLASDMLNKIGNIKISPSSLQKISKEIGSKLVEKEDENAANYTIDTREPEKKNDLLVISTDGAHIHTQEGWKEVKTGAIYQLKTKSDNKQHAINKSYVSRIENCDDFGKRLFLEARRRNMHLAQKTIVIGDGAKWIWKLKEKHFSQSIEIVDWYHATEHLWKIIELLYGNRSTENGKCFEKECEDLLYSGFILLLEDTVKNKVNELKIKEKSRRYSEIMTELNYFICNEHRMKYKYFVEMNYPIGSGVIEGACKYIVQIRMKRNGMKWSVKGAHNILQLRCLYFSGRWNEVEEIINKSAG